MEKLSLREIAAQLGCPQPPEGEITRVITDSREAGPGTLFVALPGERVDGHDYINRALAAGAEAAVAEHDGDYTPAEKVLRVKSSLRALLEISALYRAKMPAKVIGITGSNFDLFKDAVYNSYLMGTGRFDECVGFFEWVCENPSDELAFLASHYRLAEVYRALGSSDEAEREYRTVAESDKDIYAVRMAKQRLAENGL